MILRNILCIFYGFRKYEHTFTLKLFQCLICNFACQPRYLRKASFFCWELSLILSSFIRITSGRFLIAVCPCEPIHNYFLIVHSLNVFL